MLLLLLLLLLLSEIGVANDNDDGVLLSRFDWFRYVLKVAALPVVGLFHRSDDDDVIHLVDTAACRTRIRRVDMLDRRYDTIILGICCSGLGDIIVLSVL